MIATSQIVHAFRAEAFRAEGKKIEEENKKEIENESFQILPLNMRLDEFELC